MAPACFALQLIRFAPRCDKRNTTVERFNFGCRHDFGFNNNISCHALIIPQPSVQSQAFDRTFLTYGLHGQNTDLFGNRV